VNTSTTPSVRFGYANGSANTVRPTSLTYPNGRQLTYDYGSSTTIDNAASRISAIQDGSDTLAAYSYLGLNSVVQIDSPQADLRYTLVSPVGPVRPAAMWAMPPNAVNPFLPA
jgi:hypothetical protein